MGRPREFDCDEALDIITRQFWERGYEGTSFADIETAVGFSKPSLYRAFGNKEQLFQRAVDHFARHYLGFVSQALQARTAHESVRQLVRGVIGAVTGSDTPPGSLIVLELGGCACEREAIRINLEQWRDEFEQMLVERLVRARDEGELPEETDCAALSRYLATFCDGIALRAKSGTKRPDLIAMMEFALAAIPVPGPGRSKRGGKKTSDAPHTDRD
ncbi:TetR/AcrR family transcriptional regulator [Sphingopyxis indica]|uniref:TetR/AcrR family transcriptional regulator n=1 Tax=Sphingopyxis indica TaxID=436663 RepID=UPI002938E3C1|nr:TetR/AcrR family transcriptional regulator [Sphingopyxis indica]WOF44954.1 TetR/AcrR family transcriptional regulator [Sphingopyxis indica]